MPYRITPYSLGADDDALFIEPLTSTPKQPERTKGMNYSTAVFLINKNVRAISVTYERDEPGRAPVNRTTFKTFDPEITVGDYLVVQTTTRHEMTVVKVVETDVDVDFDSATPMGWIIGKVDRTDHEATLRQENQAIAAIKSAEKRKKADELRASLILDQEAIKLLALSSAGDPPKE